MCSAEVPKLHLNVLLQPPLKVSITLAFLWIIELPALVRCIDFFHWVNLRFSKQLKPTELHLINFVVIVALLLFKISSFSFLRRLKITIYIIPKSEARHLATLAFQSVIQIQKMEKKNPLTSNFEPIETLKCAYNSSPLPPFSEGRVHVGNNKLNMNKSKLFLKHRWRTLYAH